MPRQARNWTDKDGVYFIETKGRRGTEKTHRVYFISYWLKNDAGHWRKVEEKVGRSDDNPSMTPAKAAAIRADRTRGKELPNRDRRETARVAKAAEVERPTFARLWSLYDEAHSHRKDRASDKSRWETYLKPEFEKKTPDEVAQLDLDRFRIALAKTKSRRVKKNSNGKPASEPKPIAIGTQARVLELLRRLIRFGVDRDLFSPPRLKVKLPKLDNEVTERLSEAQTTALLKALRDESEDPDAADITLTIWASGMRRGEVMALRWENVDFIRGFIRIVERKGGKGVTIPMTKPAREVFERRHFARKEGSPYVFPADSKTGHRMDITKFQRRIRASIGLPDSFRLGHGLRHDFASRLAENGEDILLVSKLLGHSSVLMSQRYAHLSGDRLRKAAEAATVVGK